MLTPPEALEYTARHFAPGPVSRRPRPPPRSSLTSRNKSASLRFSLGGDPRLSKRAHAAWTLCSAVALGLPAVANGQASSKPRKECPVVRGLPIVQGFADCIDQRNDIQGFAKLKGLQGWGLDVGNIVGGTRDSDDPEVGAVLLNSAVHCTGSAISKRTVLTAAHCVQAVAAAGLSFTYASDARHPSERDTYPVESFKANDHYNASSGAYDVALLYIGGQRDLPRPYLTVASVPPFKYRALRFVGYGMDITDSGAIDPGRKAFALINVASTSPLTFTIRSGPLQNTCIGDSGGPALNDSSIFGRSIVGITAKTDASCLSDGIDARVDEPSVRSWINSNKR